LAALFDRLLSASFVNQFARIPSGCETRMTNLPEWAPGAMEITTEFLFVGMAMAGPIRVLFKPFDGGYELTPHDRSRVNLGPIENQSAGLDSGIITSIELLAPRRQHLAT
jgi:hypothetical protein